MSSKKYDSNSIETLRFPESIRRSPSMYIGGTDEHGLFVILRENADNAVDEYLAGRNKFVAISVEADGSYWVQDGGAGIPQGIKTYEVNVNGKLIKSKTPTMQAVFGELHTSGKFRSEAYSVSIGCFAGSTKIELVDGRTLSMRQLHKEYKAGIQNYVWTADRKTGELRAQPIERSMMSGRTDHLVEVTLDTGDKILCTPDHPLYKTSLTKTRAADSLGASLLAMDFDFDRDGYRVMPVVGDWPIRLHRVVASYYGQDIDGNHVHHLDGNKTNNEPTNIQALTPFQHYWEHPSKFERWMDYLSRSGAEKSALLNRRNSKGWYIRLQQQGKAVKIASRILLEGLCVNEETFNKFRFHGAPSWKKAIKRFDSVRDLRAMAASLLEHAQSNKTREYAKNFLRALEYTPGLSEASTVFDQSELTNAKRLIGKAVAALSQMPPADASAAQLDACLGTDTKKSRISSRALSKYIDLEEFVSAVRHGVDPVEFIYQDLSPQACKLRLLKFDKDDARTRVANWPTCTVSVKVNSFLRNLNAMIADGEFITRESYHNRFKNVLNNSDWYLGVRACARRGIRGRDQVLAAAKSVNHKVVSVRHIYYDEPVPVYDLSVGVDHNYRLACGVFVGNSHGVGVKGANATSEYFDVVTCFDGQWYKVGFKKGHLTVPVQKATIPKSPFTGKPLKKGTLIHFKPDSSIFSVKSFPPSMLVEWAQMQAYLNPGLQVVVSIENKKGRKTKTFLSEKGPREYIEKQLQELDATAEEHMFEYRGDLAHAVVAFSNADGFLIRGFTNGLSNSHGGKHVDSVAAALYRAGQIYAGAKQQFTLQDFKDGMLGIVNAKLHKAAFTSQDKARLSDDRMGKDFEALVFKEAQAFFKANKAMAKRVCDRAARINELKTKFKASKAVATELNKVKRQGLPPNFAPAHKSVPAHQRELLIVEGDSACFVGSTEIRTPSGPVRLDRLVEGDTCLSYEDGPIDDLVVAPRITRHVTELLEITFEDGSTVRCTPDHRFLLTDGTWCEARHLTDESDIRCL